MTAPKRETITCAAPGCDEPVKRGGPGRPRIYCTPACRPNATRRTNDPDQIAVVIDHEPVPDDTRPTGRIWKVQLQRAGHIVVIAANLGRPSANHLASQIDDLLNPHRQAHRPAID